MSTILVVDDQLVCLSILRQLVGLIDNHRAVHSFTSAKEALAWAKHNQADLILTDYKMPELNGVTFIRTLRNYPGYSDVPVIMVSGDDNQIMREEAMQVGINDFLCKPVDQKQCHSLCCELLASG